MLLCLGKTCTVLAGLLSLNTAIQKGSSIKVGSEQVSGWVLPGEGIPVPAEVTPAQVGAMAEDGSSQALPTSLAAFHISKASRKS